MRILPFATPSTIGLIALLASAMWVSGASAQPQPPLVGTVGRGAIGTPAPTPVPLGGLRTRPLTVAPVSRPESERAAPARNARAENGALAASDLRERRRGESGVWIDAYGVPHGVPYGTSYGVPYAAVFVRDAGTRVHGVAAGDAESRPPFGNALAWWPSTEAPRWQVDTTVSRVDAWRDLVVTDVVCNGAGACVPRQQRVRAPWMAACRCYAFADGWNRLWRVE